MMLMQANYSLEFYILSHPSVLESRERPWSEQTLDDMHIYSRTFPIRVDGCTQIQDLNFLQEH